MRLFPHPPALPHPDTQERRVGVSPGPSVPWRLIITSVFLKNQQPRSADSCSLTSRRFSSIIGCAGHNPCFFLPEVGNSGWKHGEDTELQQEVGMGTPLPHSHCKGCCHDSGRTDIDSCALLPPASLWIPLPEPRGSLWVGSLLGGLPRLPRDPRPHFVQGVTWAPGHTQTTPSRAVFSDDEADRDSDEEEEPTGGQAVAGQCGANPRGLPCTDHHFITERRPALCPKQPSMLGGGSKEPASQCLSQSSLLQQSR